MTQSIQVRCIVFKIALFSLLPLISCFGSLWLSLSCYWFSFKSLKAWWTFHAYEWKTKLFGTYGTQETLCRCVPGLGGSSGVELGQTSRFTFPITCKFPPLCSARCLTFVLGKVVLDPRYSTLLYFTLSPFLSVGLLRRLGYVPSLFSTSSGTHIVASGPARYRCCSQPLWDSGRPEDNWTG